MLNYDLKIRKHGLPAPGKEVTDSSSCMSAAAEGVDDVKVKAVNEMMERIKHGVVLRPVKSQESKVRPRQAGGLSVVFQIRVLMLVVSVLMCWKVGNFWIIVRQLVYLFSRRSKVTALIFL